MRDFDPTASEFISSGYLDRSRPGAQLYDFKTIASVGGSVMGAMAAGDAADAQSASADRASKTMAAAASRQRQDMMPWMNAGKGALNELNNRLGITPTGYDPDKPFSRADANAEVDRLAAENGGNRDYAIQQVKSGWNAEYATPQATQNAQTGSLFKQFDQNDLNKDLVYQNGLQFGLDTGTNELNTRAASSGGYGSGAALKALTRFGNDYGTTKTAGAYDRNMGEKNQVYSFLSGQSSQGMNAAASVGAAGMSAANGIANNQTGAGNAKAAGIVGSANAISGGIADATNAYQWNQLLNKNKGSNYNSATNGMGFDRYLSGNLGSGD